MSRALDLTYSTHFAPRPDGRTITTMAAQMARYRTVPARLALPEALDAPTFAAWQARVKEELARQLALPQPTAQPAPHRRWRVDRGHYAVEKWNFFPDDFTAVPLLALIPSGACAETPFPTVLCLPQLGDTKEFCAGEPDPDHPNFRAHSRREENRMALALVKAGFVVFVFDNPGDGETSVFSDPAAGCTQDYVREILCHGLLEMGVSYSGLSAFQKLRFLEQLDAFPFADPDRVGLCAQGLGTQAALLTGLLSDRVKCLVFHDILRDERYSFGSFTEHQNIKMDHEIEKWQVLPGMMDTYGWPDLCAAFAPRPLALTEGGADVFTDAVRRAYAACGAGDKLRVSYPVPAGEPAALPKTGMSRAKFEEYSHVAGTDRAFRADAAIALLEDCLGEESEHV